MNRVPSIENWSSTTNIKIVNRLIRMIDESPITFYNFDTLYEKRKRERLLKGKIVLSEKDGKQIISNSGNVKKIST